MAVRGEGEDIPEPLASRPSRHPHLEPHCQTLGVSGAHDCTLNLVALLAATGAQRILPAPLWLEALVLWGEWWSVLQMTFCSCSFRLLLPTGCSRR